MSFSCLDGWKVNPPAVISEDQARQGLEVLSYLSQVMADVEADRKKKLKKLEDALAEDLVVEFPSGDGGEAVKMPASQYWSIWRDRLEQYALERMPVKTLKHGDNQLARRTNPMRVGLANEDQLDEIQAALLPKLAALLEETSVAEVLPGVPKVLTETPLAGLFKLRVELDSEAIKAALGNGQATESELQQLGFEVTKGQLRCDITIK